MKRCAGPRHRSARHTAGVKRSTRLPVGLTLAALAGAGVVLFRWAATRWPRGRQIDLTAVQDGVTQGGLPRIHAAVTPLLNSISVTSLLVVGGGLFALAATRRRVDIAVAAAVLLGGANVTTLLLKPELAPRTMAGIVTRSYPSGHATAAMSIALATLLAAPTTTRLLSAVVGAGYAAAVGIATLVTGAHFPSDVAGGFCVATVWFAFAVLLLRDDEQPSRPVDLVVLGGLVVVALVGGSIMSIQHPGVFERAHLHRRAAEAVFGIAVVAAACVSAATGLMTFRSTRASPPTHTPGRTPRGAI